MKDVFKIKILFYVVLILCSCKSVKSKNEDLAKTLKESDILIRNNRLPEAQEKLSLLHKIYPNNIEVAKKLGLVKYHTNDKWGAYQMLQKADSLSKGQNLEITYSTALAAFETSKFDEANEYFNKFIKNSSDQSKIIKAQQFNAKIAHIKKFMQDSSKVEITLLSSNINTPNDEFLAFPTLDNATLLFSRRLKNGMNVSEVLMKSLKDDNGWSLASKFEDFDLATGTLSGDGNTLLSTTCERYQSIGSCDLMITYKQNGKWSLPKNMTDLINSLDWDAQPSISSDGKTIFFSSSRKGGKGGRDLYYTTKNSNGWQIPINLSGDINTIANEESPFLHADGKTLYFRSDAENGLGSYDIYLSRFDEQNNTWSKPINIGYPINTIGDDGAFTLAPDGMTAYITSNRHTLNNPRPNFDIFTFKLPIQLRAIPTSYASFVVTDKKDKKVLLPRITIIESRSSKTIYEGFVNAEGKYTTPLLTGKEYAILVELADYYPLSISYTPSVVNESISPLIVELEMEKIYSEKPIVLNNILFEVGSARMVKNVDLDLQYLLNLLKNNPTMSLKIVGHTDNTGTPESNQKLSLDRAKAVAQYLVDNGILTSRMSSEGKGESEPVASNDSDEGRRRNRRTEIFVRK